MARLNRLCPVGIPQHIVQKGNNRQVCFNGDEDMAACAHCGREINATKISRCLNAKEVCMKKILFFVLLSISFGANADRQVGEITGIIPYESGGKKLFFFQLKDNVSGGCNLSARFTFDNNKVNYDAMVSSMMAAYLAKIPVQVEYTKTCNSWGNSYDVSWVCIGNIPC